MALPRLLARPLQGMQKVMRKVNAVSKSVSAPARQLRDDLGPVLRFLGAAEVVISLRTSSKNHKFPKTTFTSPKRPEKRTSDVLQRAPK